MKKIPAGWWKENNKKIDPDWKAKVDGWHNLILEQS